MSDSSIRPSTEGSHDSEDSYHSSDYDAYDDDELETSDSEEAGFLTAPRVYHGFAPARRPFAPPVRVRALEESKTIRDPFPGRRPDQDEDDDPTTSLPRQKGESDLAFKIRKSQWKDVRGAARPPRHGRGRRGRAPGRERGERGTRHDSKGKGKAFAKGGSKQTGASPPLKNTPDFIDLTNGSRFARPRTCSSRSSRSRRGTRWSKGEGRRRAQLLLGGSTLLHFAMFPAHAATKFPPSARRARFRVGGEAHMRARPRRDPRGVAVRVHAHVRARAVRRGERVGGQGDGADGGRAGGVFQGGGRKRGENAEALARATKDGAAVIVAKPAREAERPVPAFGGMGFEQANRPRSHARAYPLHAACARHHGQTVRALLRAFPDAAAFRAQMGFEKRTPVARNSVDETRVVEGRPAARRSGGAAPAADADALSTTLAANPPSRDPRLDTSSQRTSTNPRASPCTCFSA